MVSTNGVIRTYSNQTYKPSDQTYKPSHITFLIKKRRSADAQCFPVVFKSEL